jgi:hypothetical protein
VQPDVQAGALDRAQADLGVNQGIDSLDAVILRSQPDQTTNELAKLGGRLLACADRAPGIPCIELSPRHGQLFGHVVEVDLEVMRQEVNCRALTSRKFDL